MIQGKILKTVQAGVGRVPAPVRRVMRSKTATLSCVVIGGALGAYGNGEVDGSHAIAGMVIGLGLVGLQRIPLGKVLGLIMGSRK